MFRFSLLRIIVLFVSGHDLNPCIADFIIALKWCVISRFSCLLLRFYSLLFICGKKQSPQSGQSLSSSFSHCEPVLKVPEELNVEKTDGDREVEALLHLDEAPSVVCLFV